MIGFHIDMNTSQFTSCYLEKWLKELSKAGGLIADIARMVDLLFYCGLDSNLRVETLEYARTLFGFKIKKGEPA